ncbi:MAG TPA: WecB/TagA/CpsF family glycosyltransferase, partial [Ktedonobacterales bacterium]|nr:WecB/TagA/CpsF family glycosyltransferase [Ktedonobacterales bacterium]
MATAEEAPTPARADAAPVTGARPPQPGSGQSAPSSRPQPLPLDALSLDETARRICALIEQGQRAHVVTLNPEIVMRTRRDAGLARIIHAARLVTADGVGILWALRLTGRRLPERVTGVDLTLALAERAA